MGSEKPTPKVGEEWNEALDAGIAALLRRCCSVMTKNGWASCGHQPCDYYENAINELRRLRRKEAPDAA